MITIESNFNVDDYLEQVEKEIADRGLNMHQVGDLLLTDIKEGLDTSTDLRGSPFVPNTDKWLRRKGGKPVYFGKTNNMYDSIQKTVDRFDEQVISVRGGGTHWQTDPGNQYGALPQYKRDFFGISERFLNKVIGLWSKS